MTRRLLLGAAAAWLAASRLAAQPSCTPGNEHLMSWPTANPVWQFCWVRPTGSSGSNGSGLEIREVYYNNHLVLKRGHVPILNVKYDPGGCGGPNLCYRDWLSTEISYLSDNVISTGYAEPTCPPVTVCEDPTGVDACNINPPPPDCTRTCFQGVSAEKLADRLIMTSQNEAGWYRYTMKWTFYLDGRIQPSFGFTAVTDPCVNHTHRHHAYWRFDFDIDGPDGDVVTEGPNPAGALPGRPGPKPPIVVLPTEAMRRNNRPDLTWSVIDSTTKRGYRIVPGEETELPADSFSVGDVWLLNYNANEIDDTGQSGPACAIKIGNYLNGESLANDLVLWYRTGAIHEGGDLDHCHVVGPTLVPIGDWTP